MAESERLNPPKSYFSEIRNVVYGLTGKVLNDVVEYAASFTACFLV